jgi:hypothetical protein
MRVYLTGIFASRGLLCGERMLVAVQVTMLSVEPRMMKLVSGMQTALLSHPATDTQPQRRRRHLVRSALHDYRCGS